MIIKKNQFDRWVKNLATNIYCLTEDGCPEDFLRHAIHKELLVILSELGIKKIGDYRITFCNKCNKYRLIQEKKK